MPAGADKGFAFDPPGAIGLVFDDARVMLKLHDPDVAVRPKDEAGALGDLLPPVGAVVPQVVGAAMGQGRAFWPSLSTALAAKDLATGSSLVTRGCTVMAIVQWDVGGQDAAGAPGTLVCRGDSSLPAEFVAYQLSFSVVDAAARTGSIAWSWQDIAGGVHAQAGAQFTCPTGFTLFTATRRWASSTEVVSRYYIGDLLLGEVTSSDGDIGGGVTGTFLLGCNRAGGINLGGFFAGIVDEIAVFDREMCLEEIEDTWLRITHFQPLGVQLFKELHDPGFPMSREPSSDVQLENRWIGQALGFAASRFENIRKNLVPQRAYGRVLEDWETVLRPTTQPGQSFDTRRARVLARLRQRLGSSIPGFQVSLGGLLGGADPSQLQFLAFANTIRDEFDSVDPLRWDLTPAGCLTASSDFSQFAPAAGDYAAGPGGGWLTAAMSISQPGGRGDLGQEHVLAELGIATPQNGIEVGIYFADRASNNYILLGLRDVAGSFKIETEVFTGWVSGGAVVQATLGANPATLWLHLYRLSDGTWVAEWSTTSEAGPYTASAPFAAFGTSPVFWAGIYLRSTASAFGGAADARFDFFTLRTPFGTRPLNAYALLDRALGFSPDIPGARQIVNTIKHSYVNGNFLTTPQLLCGDSDNGCGIGPCGPIP